MLTHPLSQPGSKSAGVLGTWSWAHLARACGDGGGGGAAKGAHSSLWPCFVSAPGKDRFLECDWAKNTHGSQYHIRVRRHRRKALQPQPSESVQSRRSLTGSAGPQESETERTEMSFADFADCGHSWRSRRLLLRADLLPPLAPSTALPAIAPGAASPPALLAELRELLDWSWLARELQVPLRLGAVAGVSLLAATSPSLRPARLVPDDTLLCQARRAHLSRQSL